jgi:hypothetical protein
MEFPSTQNDPYQGMQQPLPNATAVLVLGIISIVGCFCYGIAGLICGIIALILAGKSKSLYLASPGMYTEASYKNMNGGRICAIIGVIISTLYFIFFIILIATIGFSAINDPAAWRSLSGR